MIIIREMKIKNNPPSVRFLRELLRIQFEKYPDGKLGKGYKVCYPEIASRKRKGRKERDGCYDKDDERIDGGQWGFRI
jgi:hypothetical protein